MDTLQDDGAIGLYVLDDRLGGAVLLYTMEVFFELELGLEPSLLVCLLAS